MKPISHIRRLALAAVLAAALLPSAVTHTAKAAESALVPIHDTFDGDALPSGWTIYPPGGDPDTGVSVADGKLKITNSGNGNILVLKRTVDSGTLTGKVLFEYKLTVDKNSRYNLCMPALYSDAGAFKSVSQVLMVGTSMKVSNGADDVGVPFQTTEGHTYKIRYTIDYDQKTFDFAITDLTDGSAFSQNGLTFKNADADVLQSVDFWIGSEQGTPGEYDIDDLTVQPYTGNAQVPIDDYADVKAKIGQADVFLIGSPIVYNDGTRSTIDDPQLIPKLDGGEAYIPAAYLSGGSSSGTDMISASDLAASGRTVFRDDDGLIVVSDGTVFDPTADAALIRRTASLFGIFVSPDGDDSADGSFAAPFRTVDRARQAIADWKAAAGLPIDGVAVYLRNGEYPQTRSIQFDGDDSGAPGSPIVYASYPGERARITGSVSLSGADAQPVTDPGILERLPETSRGKVVQFDLKAHGITDYGQITPSNPFTANTFSYPELFVDDKRQTLARWPNDGFAYTGAIVSKDSDTTTFQFPGDRMTRWTQADDIWFQGLWTWDWYDDSLRALALHTDDLTVTVNNPAYGVSKGKPFYAFNLLEEIDEMGEWYLDRSTGMLYDYPSYSLDGADLELSMLTAPLISLQDTSNVSFERLTIEDSRGIGVSMNNTTDVQIAGATIRNLGQQGVVIAGGHHSGVASSDIYEINRGGVQLGGGDLKTLTPADNYVVNSNLYRTSLLNRTNVQPILLQGVGNRVANNMFHDVPHQAIGYEGNEHVMENNEVFNVLKETGDAGAFYTAHSWNYYNDTIRNNVFHDIQGPGTDDTYSVYLDGSTSGQNVIGNLFYNVAKPILINGGRDNKVKNNVIINSKNSILGYDYSNDNADLPSMIQYQRLMQVPYNTGIWAEKYPLLANILNDQPTYPKYNVITDNSIYNSGAMSLHDHFYQYGTVENNTVESTAPSFTDLSQLNGFDGLQVSSMGLQMDEYRQELPIVGDFRLTYPQNGSEDVQANRVPFSWIRADGADAYRLTVATDPDMSHVVVDETVQGTKYLARDLQYGGQAYYWKVEALTGSALVQGSKPDRDGVFSFTTSEQEIVDLSELTHALNSALSLYDSAVEGTGPGQYTAGSKAALQAEIENAQTVLANAGPTQDAIDEAVARLNDATALFQKQKNPELLTLQDIIPDLGNWVTSDRSALQLSQDGKTLRFQSKGDIVAGYKNVIQNYQMLKFGAKFDLSTGWQGFGFRAATPDAVAWAGTSYLIVLWPDSIELHRFGTNADLITVPNTAIQSGQTYQIELSALDKPDGVQIVFKVDGIEVINYLDSGAYIADAGCFVLYDAGGTGIEISAIPGDTEPPAITVSAPTEGADYADAGDLTPAFTVADDLSGVDAGKTSATLDGAPVAADTAIPLYTLPLGDHTFAVQATDLAGNATSRTVNFRTHADLDSLKALVTRFASDNSIDNNGIANSLQSKLNNGNVQAFLHEVEAQSGKHIAEDAANVLLRDAQSMLQS